MELTKQTLGQSYVVAAGVVLSVGLLGHAVVALERGWLAAVLILGGLVPSLTLAGPTTGSRPAGSRVNRCGASPSGADWGSVC